MKLEIQHVIKINAWFSATDWGVSESIVNRLNSTLEDYVNRGKDRATVTRFMHVFMRRAENYGTYGVAPMLFLEKILDQIYGAK